MLRDVTSRLDQQLDSVPGIPDIAWPNVDFKPDTTQPYVAVKNIPADGTIYNMKRGQETPGTYMVNVYAPQGRGPAQAENIADSIANHFATNRELGNNLFIEEINFRPGMSDDPFYVVPLDIKWIVYHYG